MAGPSSNSSPSTASGCWTCRLRRKKCDATRPTCQACRILLIPCYAYGPRPGWMDRGDREKDMLAEIRSGVKSTTERLRRGRALDALRRRHPLTAPVTATAGDDATGTVRQTATAHSRAHDEKTAPRGSLSVRMMPTTTAPTTTTTTTTTTTDPDETLLLDLYFERVFPGQFPFYHASLVERDCGWLRVLTMRCEPLKYAVLALVVTYREQERQREPEFESDPDPDPIPNANPGTDADADADLVDVNVNDDTQHRHRHYRRHSRGKKQEELYALAVAGLRDHIDRVSKKSVHEELRGGIEVFACVIYLVMLENSRGRLDNWQKHMAASPGVFPFLHAYCEIFPDPGISVLHGEEELVDAAVEDATSLDSSLSFVDHAAMEFFSAVLLWFDTLACASTGRKPVFAEVCAEAFGASDCQVRLRHIMGCENWVMIIIRDIAMLDRSTTHGQGIGLARDGNIIRKHGELKERLEVALAESWESYLSLLAERSEGREPDNWLIQATPIVTYVFACAAMVYLTVVFDGANPRLPGIRHAVTKALQVFSALPDGQMLRSLVWPFCITGCLAQKSQQSSFASLAARADTSGHGSDTLTRALQVMGTCWQIRGQEEQDPLSADWFTAMSRLGYQVLLV